MVTSLVEKNRNYLCYEVEPEDNIDSTSFRMLSSNQMYGLIPMKMLEQDEKQRFLYDISDYLSVEKMLKKGSLSLEGLFTIVCGVLNDADELADYLIPETLLLCKKESVFLDFKKNRVMIICLPVHRENEMNLEEFCRGLLLECNPEGQKEQEFLDIFKKALNTTPLDRDEVRRTAKELEIALMYVERPEELSADIPAQGKKDEKKVHCEVRETGTLFSRSLSATSGDKLPQKPEKLVREMELSTRRVSVPQKLIRDQSSGQNAFVDAAAAGTAYLVRAKNGERIYLTKDEFHIGKDTFWADYVVEDVPTISRNHATILSEAGKYYLVDNNSANGSSVDGKAVEAEKKILLVNGCSITLASEMFYFNNRPDAGN